LVAALEEVVVMQRTETVTGRIALRSPRVVVLFRGGDRWRDWARLALCAASSAWGGAGFIVVPFDPKTERVPAVLLPLVRAYDPDHLVIYRATVSDWHRLAPDAINLEGVNLEEVAERLVGDPGARSARDDLARCCSPLRDLYTGDLDPADVPPEHISLAEVGENGRKLLEVPAAAFAQQCLAVNLEWDSDSALWAAVQCGIETTPAPYPRKQPPADEVLAWALHPQSSPPPFHLLRQPQMELNADPSHAPTWFQAADPALQPVWTGYSSTGGAIVLGDTAEDFATAMMWQRLIGWAAWIPSIEGLDGPKHLALRALDASLRDFHQDGKSVRIISTSLNTAEIDERIGELQGLTFWRVWVGSDLYTSPRARLETGPLTPSSRGLLTWVLPDGLGDGLAAPALVDDTGTAVLEAGITSPLVAPERHLVGDRSPAFPYWYVDVALDTDLLPRGRDLPPSAIVSVREPWPEALVRRSRDGYTFKAINPALILNGGPLSGRLARARLIQPSLSRWIDTVTARTGLRTELSLPGQHAALLAARLGGRAQLAELIDTLGPALRLMGTRTDINRKYSDPALEHGRVIDRDVVLTLDGFAHALSSDAGDMRHHLDILLAADLLWPGFLLSCTDCGITSHVRLDAVGRTYQCPRCTATNPFTSTHWIAGADPHQPQWFYDLHPVFRRLISERGDIPLLAAHKLRTESRSYLDTAETQFVDIATGRKVFEIDLIAHVDNEVVLVEAKATPTLGDTRHDRGEAVNKLLLAAQTLRADRIILATTNTKSWKPIDVEQISRGAAGRAARLRYIPASVGTLNLP